MKLLVTPIVAVVLASTLVSANPPWRSANLGDAHEKGLLTCPDPFQEVEGRCIFLEPTVKQNWLDAREMCHGIYSELVVADDVKFYHSLLRYIKNQGVYEEDFWIGGSDSDEESFWKWIDGKEVEFGSPFWAIGKVSGGIRYYLEPHGSTDQNCLYLDHHRGLYFDDGDCSELKGAVCETGPLQ